MSTENNPVLDIIVTHWNEPWTVGRKFFDMLGCQRGIDFADIRVILVHDGTEAFEPEVFARYPYTVLQQCIPHGGVSMARNYGLGCATAKWVQFCDFDDTYTHIYALKQVMSVMDRDADYMWTPFFAEQMLDGQLVVTTYEKENIIFVHGKYFRREWLIENGIWFPEGIHYSEDSAFCAMVNELAKVGRRGRIKTGVPVYVWTYREDSVSVKQENEVRNLTGFIDRNFWVVEEFRRRKINDQLMVGRMFCDAYCAFHRADRQFPEEEARFIRKAQKYIPLLADISGESMAAVMEAAKNGIGKKLDENAEPMTAWIARIRKGKKDV